MSLFLAAAVALSIPSATFDQVANPFIEAPPTVNLSSVRRIVCDNGSGSGFLIADGVLATALHVAENPGCKDAETGIRLKTYKTDTAHDLALMTGAKLPTYMPYVKYSCERFVDGLPYMSYGISSAKGWIMEYPQPIMRVNTLYATKNYTDKSFEVDGHPSPGMRIFKDAIEFGMSGGPVVGIDGVARGLNNAGNSKRTVIYEFADTILCRNPDLRVLST